jgi:hypothetical protein
MKRKSLKQFYIKVQHHYGIVDELIDATSLKEALTKIIRADHEFLTDDNYTMKIRKDRVVVYKNEKSTPFAMAPAWVDDGPGAIWFTVYYRNMP